MGFYEDQILPRIMDRALNGQMVNRMRERACEGLHGEVLEVGFGSGLNVPYYPKQVEQVWAVDPATVGRRLAAERVAARGVTVEYVGLDGETLPLDDGSVDCVLTTWTLCSIPDVGRALDEIHRVLRPGGVLRFVEHGRAPDAQVARWQDRLTPIQRRLFGGCHLNRPIKDLIEESGLNLLTLDTRYEGSPKSHTYMYQGEARKD